MRFEHPKDLRFTCSKCGLCCGDTEKKIRHILLLKSEAEEIALQINQPVENFTTKNSDKAPYVYEIKKTPEQRKCVFFYAGRCSIYKIRPLVCRFYPFELCVDKQGACVFKATSECPGISKVKSCPSNERLEWDFFSALLELAQARFDAN